MHSETINWCSFYSRLLENIRGHQFSSFTTRSQLNFSLDFYWAILIYKCALIDLFHCFKSIAASYQFDQLSCLSPQHNAIITMFNCGECVLMVMHTLRFLQQHTLLPFIHTNTKGRCPIIAIQWFSKMQTVRKTLYLIFHCVCHHKNTAIKESWRHPIFMIRISSSGTIIVLFSTTFQRTKKTQNNFLYPG